MQPNDLKPYLIRAVLEFCEDRGLTPYIVVAVTPECRVPEAYIRDGMIVFDVTPEAVNRFEVTDEKVAFQARFGEDNQIFDVYVPIGSVAYVFPLERQDLGLKFEVTTEAPKSKEPSPAPTAPRRPTRLK